MLYIALAVGIFSVWVEFGIELQKGVYSYPGVPSFLTVNFPLREETGFSPCGFLYSQYLF